MVTVDHGIVKSFPDGQTDVLDVVPTSRTIYGRGDLGHSTIEKARVRWNVPLDMENELLDLKVPEVWHAT